MVTDVAVEIRLDTDLLREQRDWLMLAQTSQAEGLINLCDFLLDTAEGDRGMFPSFDAVRAQESSDWVAPSGVRTNESDAAGDFAEAVADGDVT